MTDLEQLAGGVIVGGFDGTVLPDEIRVRLGRGHLAGVTLFKRNIVDAQQTAELCAAIVDAAPPDLSPIISIDQEGGRVARLGPPVPQLPAMRVLGRIDDVALTRRAAILLGEALRAIGINLDFAPVVDVDSNPANPVIGDRAFGPDAQRVARHGVAVIEGLQSTGVMACAKHFPGHGDTSLDSHLALPRVEHDRARIDAVELPPFRAAIVAGVAAVMTAHVVFDALAPGVPATLSSRVVTDVLRGELGFDGVCFSDDLHMKAVADLFPIEVSAVSAIEAGCDALLVCTDPASHERARLALQDRAERDATFAGRLREAADRMTSLRQRAPARPAREPAALRAALSSPDCAGLADEIASRAMRVRA